MRHHRVGVEIRLYNKYTNMESKEEEVHMLDATSVTVMEEDDSDEATWDEIDDENESHIMCLFCPKVFKTMAVTLEHCRIDHQFNLTDLKSKFNMNCYSYICMVNYVRKHNVVPEAITCSKDTPWLNECYLVPTVPDDAWLMFDFDGLEMVPENEYVLPGNELLTNISDVHIENGIVTLPENNFIQLKQAIKFLTEQVQRNESMLATAIDQIKKMKKVAAKIVYSDPSCKEKELEYKIRKIKVSEDAGYFRSYSHFGIHHEMLSDKIRTESYRDAIILNSQIFDNKDVLDVGCGSGILSLFAGSTNAKKIFAVDPSDIIYQAIDIVRENNLSHKIELIHGIIEEIVLPVEKVDIIISEWIGYFLLYEGMLESILHARDKYLSPNGYILPNRCSLHIVGLSDYENYQKMIGFWSDVYGFKMSCLRREALEEPLVTEVPFQAVVTSAAVVFDLDLYKQTVEDTLFCSSFSLESHIDGELTALCGYFSVFFDLPKEVSFSTSPHHSKTHWKQTVFFLPQFIPVQKGMIIQGYIKCTKKADDNRALTITIDISDQKNTYILM